MRRVLEWRSPQSWRQGAQGRAWTWRGWSRGVRRRAAEIKHNQGLPLLPAQRLDEHVRRLIWACRRFSTDHALVELFHQIRRRVLSVHLHHVNGAFHVPPEHAHQRGSSRTGWAGQQQHPGIGPFGEVPSKLIQDLVTPDEEIKSFASRGFRPKGFLSTAGNPQKASCSAPTESGYMMLHRAVRLSATVRRR